MGLYCNQEDLRSVIQSMMELGAIVGLLTLVPFSDFEGKRYVILISIMFQFLGSFLVYLGIQYTSFFLLITGQLMFGAGLSGFDISSYVMMV